MVEPTKEELIRLGEIAYRQKQKDKLRSKAVANAIQILTVNHKNEFETILAAAKRELGV